MRAVPSNNFMKFSRILRFVAFLAVAVSSVLPARAATTFVVQSPGFSFRPTNLTINVNDSVRWTNSHSGVTHDTTFGTATTPATNRLWSSGPLDSGLGQTFTFTFSNAGYYPYICNQHVVLNPVAPQQTGSVTVTTANLAPSINFTSPLNNARATNVAGVTLFVDATDTNGAVANVRFFDSGVLLGMDTTPPYSFFASNLAPGLHPFTAVVTDNLGLTATSSVVNVTVSTVPVTNLVRVTNFLFSPAVVTVAAGSLVIFSNSTSGGFSMLHTATGVGGSLEPLCGVTTLTSGAPKTIVFSAVNWELILAIQSFETGTQSASVNKRYSYFAALIPSVKAYFLLPQKASLFSTLTNLMLECSFSNSSKISNVLSLEASSIKTISNCG